LDPILEVNLREIIRSADVGSLNRQKNQKLHSRFLGVDENGILLFKTISGTTKGKWWKQKVQLLDLSEAVAMIQSGVDMTDAELINITIFGNIKVPCDCPAFLYWAWKYMAWGLDYGIEPETRAPKRNNINLLGSACKHLISVMRIMPFNISNILQALREKGLIPERPEEENEINDV